MAHLPAPLPGHGLGYLHPKTNDNYAAGVSMSRLLLPEPVMKVVKIGLLAIGAILVVNYVIDAVRGPPERFEVLPNGIVIDHETLTEWKIGPKDMTFVEAEVWIKLQGDRWEMPYWEQVQELRVAGKRDHTGQARSNMWDGFSHVNRDRFWVRYITRQEAWVAANLWTNDPSVHRWDRPEPGRSTVLARRGHGRL